MKPKTVHQQLSIWTAQKTVTQKLQHFRRLKMIPVVVLIFVAIPAAIYAIVAPVGKNCVSHSIAVVAVIVKII